MTPLTEQCKTLALPTPYRILGQVLEPLCVGHMALFDRLDLKECSTRDHLLLFVLVCSHKPSELPQALTRWRSKVKWALWGRRCYWALKCEAEFQKRRSLFADYLDEHTKVPDSYIRENHQESDSKIPFHQYLRVSLIANLGYKPEMVADAPYRQAVLDLMTYQEQQGAIEITDGYRGEHADEMFEAANLFHEQRMKGGRN